MLFSFPQSKHIGYVLIKTNSTNSLNYKAKMTVLSAFSIMSFSGTYYFQKSQASIKH